LFKFIEFHVKFNMHTFKDH